jgi:hypothetical protein
MDGDGKADDPAKEKEFSAVVARLKVIKYEIAKRDAQIARLQAERKATELKLTTLEMNTKSRIQGMWTVSL